MTVTAEQRELADVAATGGPKATEAGLLDEMIALSSDVRELAEAHLQLAALEAKLAGRSLLTIIAAALAIALLLVGAWFGLMAAVVVGLAAWGLSIAAAILVIVVLNVGAAILLLRLIRRRSRQLGFPATVRSLKVMGLRRGEGEPS